MDTFAPCFIFIHKLIEIAVHSDSLMLFYEPGKHLKFLVFLLCSLFTFTENSRTYYKSQNEFMGSIINNFMTLS